METRTINPDTRWAPFGATVAPPGAVVFHRYLQQLNNEHRIDPARDHTPSQGCPCPPFRRSIQDTADLTAARPAIPMPSQTSDAPSDAAKISDITEIAGPPQATPITQIVFQQGTPITGRLIDILA